MLIRNNKINYLKSAFLKKILRILGLLLTIFKINLRITLFDLDYQLLKYLSKFLLKLL